MTSSGKSRNSGPPPPITELTYEQDFKLRQIHDALKKPETKKEDIVILLMALQEQCYVLSNCVTNLLAKWPKDQPTTNVDQLMFGILLDNKNSTST